MRKTRKTKKHTNIYKGKARKNNMQIVKCSLCGKVKSVDNRVKSFKCCHLMQKIERRGRPPKYASRNTEKNINSLNDSSLLIEQSSMSSEEVSNSLPSSELVEEKVLIIEKSPEKPIVEEKPTEWAYRCGKCNSPFNDLVISENGHFCPICGCELEIKR